MHLIVFSSLLTSRIKYIFNGIFKDILKAEVVFTSNKQFFLQSSGAKISYGNAAIADELFFKHSPLLLSNKVEELSIKKVSFGEYDVPFPVSNSALPFDVFAASFFIITRYEEYIHQKNSDEDFKAAQSLQSKWKMLERPVIDEWALMLKSMISRRYPEFKFPEKKFSYFPILHFDLVPHIPGSFIDKTKFIFSTIFQKDNHFISHKFDELTGVSIKQEQIIESLNQQSVHQKNKTLFFINFPQLNPAYLNLNGMSEKLSRHTVGLLRPCASDPSKTLAIRNALTLFKKVLPQQIVPISQQLENLKFPICYLNIINLGITDDYSMGYQDIAGFRAGTCTPFNWYDLQLEKATSLRIHSYVISDTQLKYLPLDEGKAKIKKYLNAIKFVDGNFHTCWNLKHLSTSPKYKKTSVLFNSLFNQETY